MNCPSTCKTSRVQELQQRGYTVAYVGDGYSDRCAAPRADRVFAKGVLAAHCAELEVAHHPFVTLAEVAAVLNHAGE